MLKHCVLLLLSLTALNCEIWNEQPRKLTSGKDLLYRYDAQILTGIPTSSWHYTGYRLLAQVRLVVQSTDKIQMRLEEIRFRRMSQEIAVDEPTVFLPRELFEDMAKEAVARLIESELQRPLQFRWKQGVVSELEVDVKDQFWSVNMKKGLVNMLNMDLTPQAKEDRMKWNGNFVHSNYEDGIEGRCRSAYHWNRLAVLTVAEQQKKSEDNVAITMVKTRDLEDCLETPVFEHVLAVIKDCDERRMNVSRDLVKAEATTRANVTYWKNKKDFFTWSVHTDARYTFAPISAKSYSISTFVKQNLTFVEERATDAEKTKDEKKKNPKTEEKVEMRKEATLQMIVPIPEIMPKKNATEELTHVVFDILTQIRAQLKQHNPKLMTLLKDWVLVLRQAPKDILYKVHQECAKRANEEAELFDLFHDILPSVATREAAELFVEEGVFSPVAAEVGDDLSVAARVRRFGLMNHVVHKDMIFTFINAATRPAIQKKTNRRETLKALIMTVSSLTKTYMDQRKRPELEFTPDYKEDVVERVFTFLNQLLETEVPCLAEQEKFIIVVRALGNAALPKGLDLLTNLLSTKKLPVAARVQCIYALRQYAPERPHLVRQYLLPIFFDLTKDAELRIASYLVVMRTRPDRSVLDSIVESIRREPVEQVQTFVMSHLKSVVEAPCHCDCMVVSNISLSIESLRFKNAGLQYSQVHHFPLTETERVVMRTDTIFTPEELVPRSANVRVLTQGNGREINLFEMGVRTEGLQSLLDKLVGPNGKLFSVTRLQELIKAFEPTETLSEINLSFYVNLFGEEMNFWTINGEVKTLLENGFKLMPKNFMLFFTGKEILPLKFHRTMFTDAVMRIPTTFGLPFTANFTSMLHMDTTGQIEMKRGIFDEEMLQAVIRVTPRIFTQHLLEAGIDATITKAFTQVRFDAHVPALKNVTVNVMYMMSAKAGFRVHIENPTEEWRLIEINSTMNCVYTEMRRGLDYAMQTIAMPIKFDMESTEQQQPMEFDTPIEPLGLTVSGQLKYNLQPRSRYPMPWPMRGYFQFTAILRSTENRLKEGIEFRIVPVVKRPQNNEKDLVFGGEKTVKFQLLRAKLMVDRTFERDDETKVTESNGQQERRPINKKLRQEDKVSSFNVATDENKPNNHEKLIAEVIFTRNTSEKIRRFQFRIAFKTGKAFQREYMNKQFMLKGVVIFPKPAVDMNRQNPLHIENVPREENQFVFKCRIVDENESDLLQYKMTFDRDEFAVRFFKHVSKNVQRYRAMHPMLNQCYEDLQQKLPNSPACHFTQRYLNLFNRQNHTLILSETAPTIIKRFVNYIVATKLTFLSKYMGEISTTDPEKVLDSFEKDEFFAAINDNKPNTKDTRTSLIAGNDDAQWKPVETTHKKKPVQTGEESRRSDDAEWKPVETTHKKRKPVQTGEASRRSDDAEWKPVETTHKKRKPVHTGEESRRPVDSQMSRRLENGDKIYHISIVAAPFDLRILTVNYLLDTILLRFDSVILPTTWFSHMHATNRFHAVVMGALSQERLPAVCHIHTAPHRAAVEVMTFDALLYKPKTVFPIKGKRVILSQDLENRFQVSAAVWNKMSEIQILTRDFNRRIQILRASGTEKMRVLVDGETPRTMPLIVKNEQKQIVLRIEVVSETTGNARNQIVRVELPLLGVRLTTDVSTLFDLEVSPFYHNVLRGVCGDFDGERRQEMKTPDCKKFFLHPEEVFYSEEFVVPTTTEAEQQPRWIPLKRCERGVRLQPITAKPAADDELLVDDTTTTTSNPRQ